MSSASPSGQSPTSPVEPREASAWSYSVHTPLTSLLGRDREVAEVRALLDDDVTRLVTLTGAGGIGKTRLATEVASQMTSEFANGACFVALAAIRDHEHIASAVAKSLGIPETGRHTVAETLAAALKRQHLLLVLDNMEQLVGAGPWLAELLEACPRVKALATSRILLQVRGERAYPVPPLHAPSADRHLSVELLGQCEAVALFAQRASVVQPAFTLTPANAETVRDICLRLDGVPLAIELAAARVNVLSPAAILARLTHRLKLLTSGMRDAPPRHQTMRDAIAWSHELLAPAEQAVFRRLAIFNGSFTLEAAEVIVQVGGGDDDDVDAGGIASLIQGTGASTLDLLASLCDQSILQQVPVDTHVVGFRMLETIREYGLDQLVRSGEYEQMARRHAEWVLDIVERAAPRLTGPDQVQWLNHLGAMHDDIRAAYMWMSRSGKHEFALRLVTELWPYAYTRGHYSEARRWLDDVLVSNPSPSVMRAEALNAAGVLASIQGDTAMAIARHTEARELSASLEDKRGLAFALNGLGIVAEEVEEDSHKAYQRYSEARDLFQEIGDRRGVALMLTNLGNLRWKDGALQEAIAHHTKAGELFRASGGPRGVAWAATNLGSIALEQGDLVDAAERLRVALGLYRELGDRSGMIETLERFADIAGARGQHERQVQLLGAAAGMREAINLPVWASERDQYDATLSELRRQLGEPFDVVWSAGRVMALDDVLEFALDADSALPADVSASEVKPAAMDHGLSRRETEVLVLMAEGLTNKEIAASLFISPRTVTSHTTSILGKLGVASRTTAVAYAIRHGIA